MNFVQVAREPIADLWSVGLETLHSSIFCFEQNAPRGRQTSLNQVFDEFVLAIHRDRATSEVLKVDTMALAVKTKFDAVVDQAFALHPFAHAHLHEQIDGARLQHSRPNTFLAILTRPVFEHDGVDAVEIKQVRQYKPGGPGSDNSDLRA
jgi:hypothetical protein